jgi:hypothetical protein
MLLEPPSQFITIASWVGFIWSVEVVSAVAPVDHLRMVSVEVDRYGAGLGSASGAGSPLNSSEKQVPSEPLKNIQIFKLLRKTALEAFF